MHRLNRLVSRTRGSWLLLAISLLLMMLGCSRTTSALPTQAEEAEVPPAPAALPPGDTTRSLVHASIEYEYLLHVPPGYDAARPIPLVLAFHGYDLDGSEMARISGFSAQADASDFIVAYPTGSGKENSWNGGYCCGEAARNKVDDVGFVRALITDISSFANIDPRRIYATGFSNGAIFVYRLACVLSDQIAAFGPVSATQTLNDEQACKPGRPMAIIHFHGTADRLNAYQGGPNAAGVEWVSVPDAMAYWAEKNGCPAEPASSTSGSIVHDVYGPCTQNASIELYTVNGGEHAWPGGEAVSVQVGEPTMEISATPLMWEFFAAHPLP